MVSSAGTSLPPGYTMLVLLRDVRFGLRLLQTTSRLRLRGDADAGPGHRGHHRDIQRRLRPVLRAAAVSPGGSPGDGLGAGCRASRQQVTSRNYVEWKRAVHGVLRHQRVGRTNSEPRDRRSARRACSAGRRDAGIPRDARLWSSAGPGTKLRRGRGHPRARQGRHLDLSVVAGAVRRRSRPSSAGRFASTASRTPWSACSAAAPPITSRARSGCRLPSPSRSFNPTFTGFS